MNLFSKSALAMSIFLLLGSTASAETVLRTGETVSVSESQGIVGDFYSLASILNISGRVEGDVIAAAGRTTINGEVSEDILVLGGSVDIYGTVGDDVRVVGGEVIIAESVAGNVFVVGGAVTVLSTAAISGDLLVYGGEVEMLGTVEGDVLGGYGSLRIDGDVLGAVDVRVDQLTLGENANVAGSVSYVSTNLLERAPNTIVSGEILRNDTVANEEEANAVNQYAIAVLVLAFASLTWFLISRKTLVAVAEEAVTYAPKPIMFAVLILLFVPLIIVILMSSLLGSLVGFILLISYLLTILLVTVAAPVTIGLMISKVMGLGEDVNLVVVALGILVVALLPLLPVVGPLLLLAAGLLTLAGGVGSVYRLYKS